MCENNRFVHSSLDDTFTCYLSEMRTSLVLFRKYFGEKIGLYFAWLGLYTQMLIPASLVGVFVFLYGCATVDDNIPRWTRTHKITACSQTHLYAILASWIYFNLSLSLLVSLWLSSMEICHPKNNITMCPLCDTVCGYWKLSTACGTARASHLFDNPATVFFSIFMALWGQSVFYFLRNLYFWIPSIIIPLTLNLNHSYILNVFIIFSRHLAIITEVWLKDNH